MPAISSACYYVITIRYCTGISYCVVVAKISLLCSSRICSAVNSPTGTVWLRITSTNPLSFEILRSINHIANLDNVWKGCTVKSVHSHRLRVNFQPPLLFHGHDCTLLKEAFVCPKPKPPCRFTTRSH